ncbi:MAG: hypothetical protein SF339_25225 [Blastocatellia bacterium]|nr:hypothetical protein [Blastocatellia bacterium]
MAIRLFVGNLPRNVTEAELKEHFSPVGALSFISIPVDRETGRHRGFAFLEFRDRAQAEEAIRSFNNKAFKGNLLAVSEARPREDRPISRPPISRPSPTAPIDLANAPAKKPGANFGPDASPQRGRAKPRGKAGPERAPKGPMREIVRGQFFGDPDDDYDEEDDIDANQDLLAEEDDAFDDDLDTNPDGPDGNEENDDALAASSAPPAENADAFDEKKP